MSTRHFSDRELQCKCQRPTCYPGPNLPPQEFQDQLEELRRAYGQPMTINSGKRCGPHNVEESSTGFNGPHVQGAVDVKISGRNARELIQAAAAQGLLAALRELGLASPAIDQALRDPSVIARSCELAWSGIGLAQKSRDHNRRFVHLDNLRGQTRPWVWTY